MTNGMTDIVPGVAPLPLVPIIIHTPWPWDWLFLVTLWIVVVFVAVSGIDARIKRKRKGQSTATESRKIMMVSVGVFFLGTGVNLWRLAAAFTDVYCCVSISPGLRTQFLSEDISKCLHGLAINTIVAGFGFVVAMVLKEEQGIPNHSHSHTGEPAADSPDVQARR